MNIELLIYSIFMLTALIGVGIFFAQSQAKKKLKRRVISNAENCYFVAYGWWWNRNHIKCNTEGAAYTVKQKLKFQDHEHNVVIETKY